MDKKYRGTGEADRAIRQGIEKGLNKVGADLVSKSVQLAPKREGHLRGSAEWDLEGKNSFLSSRTVGESKIALRVSFNVPYAKIQHENESFKHTMGQAKYLGEPLRNNAGSYSSLISAAIRRELRSDL